MDMPTNQPTAVILDLDENGQRGEMALYFPTRFQAEWFVYQLPYLMTCGDWTQVKAAMLSPLVVV